MSIQTPPPGSSGLLPMSSDSGSSCFERLLAKAAPGLPVSSGKEAGQAGSPQGSDTRHGFPLRLRRCYSCMVGIRLSGEGSVSQAETIFKSLYETQLRLNEILVGKLRELEASVRKEMVTNSRLISDYEQLISKLMRFHYWKVSRVSQGASLNQDAVGSPEVVRQESPEPLVPPLTRAESGRNPQDPSPFSTELSAVGKPKAYEDPRKPPELHYFLCTNCGKTNALVESKVASTNDYDSYDPRRGGRLPTPKRPTGSGGVFRFSHR
jgi:hypothetical protein